MAKNSSAFVKQKRELIQVYRRALLLQANLEELDRLVETELEHISNNLMVHEAEVVADTHAWKQQLLPKVIQFGALVVPAICLVVGLYLIGSAAFPIAVAYWNGSESQSELISVIPEEKQLETTPIMISQIITSESTGSAQTISTPKIIDIDLDYTNLANWFPGSGSLPELAGAQTGQSEYRLDIPKLKVENALVTQGGTDLNKSLIAFPGTALPGQYGAPVIFGHSVLRQFYNPSEKNPRRYTSIFSTIMTLKNGDEILLTYNGVRYTYVVQEKTEVKPTDVYILNQKYDAKRLKLVTCTPEGTYLRRGVITAELVGSAPL